MENKILNDLSFSMRAGKLVIGFDTVKKTVLEKKIFLLITAKDVSDNTKKEIDFLAKKHDMPYIIIDVSMDELWYLLGKKGGIIGVTDKSFTDKILASYNFSILQQEDCQ